MDRNSVFYNNMFSTKIYNNNNYFYYLCHFNSLSIYTSVNLKLGTEQDLINIGYIFFIALIVFSILLILYLIIKIKNFSITKSYTNNRLKVLLTEILIEKEQRKQEWLKKKKK